MTFFNRIIPTKYTALSSAILVIAGMCIFALFIHVDSCLRILSFAGLILAAVIISRSVRDIKSLLAILGIIPFMRKAIYYSMGGIIFGVLLGVLYNFIKADYLLPPGLTNFALIAPLIGITEELVFRGFVQSRSASLGTLTSILLASSGHTLYKYLVIRTVPVDLSTNFTSLIILTFTVGIVFGIMREASKSVIPPALVHGIFDIIVYGGATLVPVWIWG